MNSALDAKREIFAVLEHFSSRFSSLTDSLEPITQAAQEGPLLQGVDVLYRPETDVALLGLRFDPRSASPSKLGWVTAAIERASLPVLDPVRLSGSDHDKLYRGYLPRYRVRVDGRPTPRDALEELARLLELPNAPARRPKPSSGQYSLHRASSGRHPGLAPTQTASRRLNQLKVGVGRASARGKGRAYDRGNTLPGTPKARSRSPEAPVAPRARPATASRPPRPQTATPPPLPPPPRAGTESPQARARPAWETVPTRAASPSWADLVTTPTIEVRFLRGDEWFPARLRALNLRGGRFATSAPPRHGDTIHVAIRYAHDLALLRGEVVEAIAAESGGTGSTGFRLTFVGLAGEPRERLIAILTRARADGVSLSPPPPRQDARFPVRWPVQVISAQGRVRAAALDVSMGGLFVATTRSITGDCLHFHLPLDVGGTPIHGRARLARVVDDEMASSRGFERGYGVQILQLSDADSQRYGSFLERVRQRSSRRVLVAAGPERAHELATGLLAAGYSVTTSSDPQTLLRVAGREPRPPDAAVLDASLDSRMLRDVFAKRRVPCVQTLNEGSTRTRAVVDRMLSVAA